MMARSLLARIIALAAAALMMVVLGVSIPASARPAPASISPVPHCLTNESVAPPREVLSDVPSERLATLARGVNVTDLFEPGHEQDVDAAFRRLHAAGIRHVRIPISPEVFADNPPSWQAAALSRLDQTVCSAIAIGVGVVIDLHPFSPLGPPGEAIETTTMRVAAVWRRLAGRYARAPVNKIFFEILNEPKLPDERQWETMQAALAHAIRSVAPGSTLIATASPWSTAAALSSLTPLADRNVVYTFHLYTPMIFTHQGADWSLPDYASIGGLVFPARADNVAAVASRAAPDRQSELAEYGRDFRNFRPIETEVETVAGWAQRNGTVANVTEFGVYEKAVPRPARAAWLADVRRTLEAHNIGWTVWEYQGGFGIADDLHLGCVTPASAATALGLCGQ
jgi:endoglucanase